MHELKIPAGSSILIGAPARPMDQRVSIEIGKLIDSIDGIFEAHLPQMFVPEVMDQPAQVLVFVLRQDANLRDIIGKLGPGLSRILPEGVHLDVWPIPLGHQMVDDIRRTGCLI
jgi:hypothetical protein